VMALSTGHGGAHPDSHRRVDPVDDGGVPKLLVLRSAFTVGQGIAMKRRGDELVFGRVRQQVARGLLDCELIAWHVVVACPDDAIARGSTGAGWVAGVTAAVGVAGQV